MNNTRTGSKPNTQVKGMVQVALFAALIIIMAFTPFQGISRSDFESDDYSHTRHYRCYSTRSKEKERFWDLYSD